MPSVPPEINENFNTYLSVINNLTDTKSLESIYNLLTNKGIVLFSEGDYQICLEAHYDFEWLQLSIWFEPADFEKRKKLISLQIF